MVKFNSHNDQDAMNGHPEAQFERGEHLRMEGEDLDMAAFWLALAARQGHADAMFASARMIQDGEGPVKDPAQKWRWYRLAAIAGHRDAADELEDWALDAPPELVAEEGPEFAKLRREATCVNPPGCYELAKHLEALGSTDAKAEAAEWMVWADRYNWAVVQRKILVAPGPPPAQAAPDSAEPIYRMALENKEERDRYQQLLAAAAVAGYPEAQFLMGKRLDYHEQLYPKALAWYRRAAASLHAGAVAAIAEHLLSGKGIEQDVDKGVAMLEQAAGMGCVDAMLSLAHREDSFEWYSKAADADSAEGNYEVALRLTKKGDPEAAEPYLRRAAEQGYQNAESLLEDWIDEKTTHRSECERLTKLADKGDNKAAMTLAGMVERGESPYEPERALYFYQMAADRGDKQASYIVGKHLLDVPRGAQHGRDYLEYAASKGHKEAKALLKSLPKEEEPATLPDGAWSEDPLSDSIAGNLNAQYQLGFAHFSGVGAKKSMALAYFWLKVVGRSTPAVVEQMIDAIGQQMKKPQRAAMDRAVGEWKVGTPPPAV